jgi:3-deoxy-manno-octulosonate cytidylyltransferase (CMP-KDO synthetase)
MTQNPSFHGIIPARYASTRFPGKPLADILGKPMFWHVYERARQCTDLARVVLATDDVRILEAAGSLNVPALMTASHHPSGTDRVLEAAEKLALPESAVVVNIQGDEPALEPQMIHQLIAPFKHDETVQVSTLATTITPSRAQNPNQVKVVFDTNGRALYFSRAPIPHATTEGNDYFWGHIGLYAFRMKALRKFVSLKTGRLESLERLEQLRLLENGIPIQVVTTKHRSIGVDEPGDLATAKKLITDDSSLH